MRQISLRVRAASSTKWGSTVNMALCEAFTTRCILRVVIGLSLEEKTPFLYQHPSIHLLHLHIPVHGQETAASPSSIFHFSRRGPSLASPSSFPPAVFFPSRPWSLPTPPPLCCPVLSDSAPYLLFTAAISSPYATLCHNTIIHASAGRRWKCYLASISKSDMQNPKSKDSTLMNYWAAETCYSFRHSRQGMTWQFQLWMTHTHTYAHTQWAQRQSLCQSFADTNYDFLWRRVDSRKALWPSRNNSLCTLCYITCKRFFLLDNSEKLQAIRVNKPKKWYCIRSHRQIFTTEDKTSSCQTSF